MTTHGRRALLALTLVTLGSACAGDAGVTPNEPQAVAAAAARGAPERRLAIELATTAAGDAGMIFSVQGPNITGISAAPGYQLVSRQASAGNPVRLDVLVIGPLQSGIVAWLHTRGVNSGNPFAVEVTQVAAGVSAGFAQRDDLGAYALSVRREP